MKKIYFVYNPYSGKGKIGNKLNDIIKILAGTDNQLTVVPTTRKNDAAERIQNLTEKYDLVVCSGGDGTLDEVVTGMVRRPVKQRYPIGYIPSGTTNDFARSLNISKVMTEAARCALEGEKFPCDVGNFNEDHFVYIAAFGIFTEVSYSTKQEFKSVLGHMAYVLEAMKSLYHVRSYQLKVTSQEQSFEGDFIFGMVTNSKSVAGFKGLVGKNVIFDDGVFEVTFVKKPQNPIELQEILTSLLKEEINTKYMYSFRSKEIHVECEEEVSWTLDGEFGGNHKTVDIRNEQKAIEIVVPIESLPEIS